MADTLINNQTNQITQNSPGTRTLWFADPAHTDVSFSAKHMMIATVKGRFTSVEASLELDEADFTNSTVEAKIDAASLYTGVDYRDNHLRSADFILAEQYPNITFQSTRIERTGEDQYNVYGDLTIRGIAKPVVLDATFEGRGIAHDGKEHIGFSARATVNRKDWGLNWNVALETGGVLVGEQVKIAIDLELIKLDTPQQ
ncbi:MAG TPA: YceI family protein [Chloroflexia bacterium]